MYLGQVCILLNLYLFLYVLIPWRVLLGLEDISVYNFLCIYIFQRNELCSSKTKHKSLFCKLKHVCSYNHLNVPRNNISIFTMFPFKWTCWMNNIFLQYLSTTMRKSKKINYRLPTNTLPWLIENNSSRLLPLMWTYVSY